MVQKAEIRHRRSKDLDKIIVIGDETEEIVSEDANIKERWKHYFNKLLNAKNNRGMNYEWEKEYKSPLKTLLKRKYWHRLQ